MVQNPYQSPQTPLDEEQPFRIALGNRYVWILGIAFSFAHLMISAILFISLYSAELDRFDNGGKTGGWERPAQLVLSVLSFPLTVVLWRGPPFIHVPIVLLNSSLWGFGVAWLVRLCLRLRQKR